MARMLWKKFMRCKKFRCLGMKNNNDWENSFMIGKTDQRKVLGWSLG